MLSRISVLILVRGISYLCLKMVPKTVEVNQALVQSLGTINFYHIYKYTVKCLMVLDYINHHMN